MSEHDATAIPAVRYSRKSGATPAGRELASVGSGGKGTQRQRIHYDLVRIRHTALRLNASRVAAQFRTSSITHSTSLSVSSGYMGSDRTLAADLSVTGSEENRAARPHGTPSC
jgi:hypothetical protein